MISIADRRVYPPESVDARARMIIQWYLSKVADSQSIGGKPNFMERKRDHV